jgi:hypothetical protein
MEGDQVDFFISHAGADRAWAEWVAWQLTEAGHSVELDVWDWAAGQNFILQISDALDRAGRVIALWSAAYFSSSRYTGAEWSAAWASGVPGHRDGRLVPLRIESVAADQVPGLLRPVVYQDLFGLDEGAARPSQPPSAADRRPRRRGERVPPGPAPGAPERGGALGHDGGGHAGGRSADDELASPDLPGER